MVSFPYAHRLASLIQRNFHIVKCERLDEGRDRCEAAVIDRRAGPIEDDQAHGKRIGSLAGE